MKKRRVLIGLSVFLLLASLAFAGGGKEGTVAAPTAQKPITLSMFVNINWYNWPEWGMNEVTKAVTEKTGVTLKFTWPAQGDNQQFNLLLASGDLPDYILQDQQNPTYEKPIQAGLIEDLGPLMDKYAPEMRVRMTDGYWKFNAAADGKNYAFVNAEMHPGNIKRYIPVGGWNPATWVKEDLYKTLGEPKVDTPDGLFNVLKAAQAQFPTVRPFWIGASPANFTPQPYGWDYWFAQFGVEKYYDQNGQLSAKYKDPKYLEALLWLNRLYKAGLIKREDLAATADQFRSEVDAGKIFFYSDGFTDWNTQTGYRVPQANPSVQYIPVPMFTTATILQQGSIGWCGWMITTKAKDKARAIQFMSYCVSQEGEELLTYGVKGENQSDQGT
jgi:putative aldouronate transport system substrate-binding protein